MVPRGLSKGSVRVPRGWRVPRGLWGCMHAGEARVLRGVPQGCAGSGTGRMAVPRGAPRVPAALRTHGAIRAGSPSFGNARRSSKVLRGFQRVHEGSTKVSGMLLGMSPELFQIVWLAPVETDFTGPPRLPALARWGRLRAALGQRQQLVPALSLHGIRELPFRRQAGLLISGFRHFPVIRRTPQPDRKGILPCAFGLQ